MSSLKIKLFLNIKFLKNVSKSLTLNNHYLNIQKKKDKF